MFFVTTFNKKGYNLYAKNMIKSFLEFSSIPIKIYYEDIKPDFKDNRIEYINIFDSSPELVEFIGRNRYKRVSNFKFDGIRFSYKVFSIAHAGLNSKDNWMFWVDADTLFRKKVDPNILFNKMRECSNRSEEEINNSYLACFMRRAKKKNNGAIIPTWTECGFVGYNLSKDSCIHFIKDFKNRYVKDYIYKEKQQHDSWIFDVVRSKMSRIYSEKAINLNPKNYTHPIVMTKMGELFDHLKGNGRKIKGYSPEAKGNDI